MKARGTGLKTCEKPIFIYGMGDGAEKLLDEFDRLGIKCTGVFASDDFVPWTKLQRV